MIKYKTENDLSVEEFRMVLVNSTLGERSLAVDEAYQKQGIGKELIRQTKIAAPEAKLILLAAPAAILYYPKLGMDRHNHCFYLDDLNNLK